MREILVESIRARLRTEISPQNPLKYLLRHDVREYTDHLISVVYLYTRQKKGFGGHTIYLTELICAIGHTIRGKFRLKKDSSLAAKTGAFLLYSFEELGFLQVVMGHGQKGHNAYLVQVLDDDGICQLWNSVEPGSIEKLPNIRPYGQWRGSRHETGWNMVKTGSKDVLDALSPQSHPMVFECLNRAQRIGWTVNEHVLNIQMWALRNKVEAFSDIWEQTNPEARNTKLREARAVIDIASRFVDKVFYHLYYYDFRGRKYPATAYLHEQGNDVARGLLLRADRKPIGRSGFFWLMVSLASSWAGDSGRIDRLKTDKLPLKDRAEWAADNEEILLSYAENPKVNQGWMRADHPWQFLATCFELKSFRDWQASHRGHYLPSHWAEGAEYMYESGLEVFIDGSNNGSQHLAALTRDEVTAPHVNLVPLDLPGDLYKYIADHVWAKLEKDVSGMTEEEKAACERLIDNIVELKKEINECEPKSDRRSRLAGDIHRLKHENAELMAMAAPVFWCRIKDAAHRRKIVKRNTMTIPYGGTAYGLGQQIIDDSRKHGIELLYHMEHRWGAFLGREVYTTCREALRRPMQLLAKLERAGREAEREGRFLSWVVPLTHFPVVQHYTEGITKKLYVQYGPPAGPRLSTGYYSNTLQLAVCFVEELKPSKGKQSQGASPNAIHSLDAAHLMLTVCQADFPVTTVHDSYGCLLADMQALYPLIRDTFVQLYQMDPLGALLSDMRTDASGLDVGSLDVGLIRQSEYCFC
jgi:DNA-directed RNA polymerase